MKIFYDKDYEMVCGENVIEWNFIWFFCRL